jgi:hypothetical protein
MDVDMPQCLHGEPKPVSRFGVPTDNDTINVMGM